MVEGRRGFLKKSAYISPVLIALGSLNAHASGSRGDDSSSGIRSSTLHGNNGWGNGDQCAPGNSQNHNSAENDQDDKKKVNHVGVETHGGHEKDIKDDGKSDSKYKTDSKYISHKFKNS